MAVVKPYPVGEAQARPLGGSLPERNGSAAAFGPSQPSSWNWQDGTARDLAVAGANLGQASNNMGEIALGIAKDVNDSKIQELNNDFIKSQQDLLYNGDKAFYRQQGKNAIDAAPAATQALIDLKTNIINQTSNPYQRERLSRMLGAGVAEANNGISRFVAAQSMEWQKQTDVATAKLMGDEGHNNWADPVKLQAAADRAAQAGEALALRSGHAPGTPGSEVIVKEFRSKVYGNAVGAALASGNTAAAISLYDRVKPTLDSETDKRLESAIKTARTQDTARTQAMVLANHLPGSPQAEEGTKASLQFWKGDGYSQKVAAGITAGFLRESQFSTGTTNRGDGRDGSDSINIGQWNAERAAAFKKFAADNKLDINDPATGMKYAKAEIDGVIPYSISGLSPEFKARLMAAKTEAEAADIMTRGYFRPKYQDGESAFRQKSAGLILAKYGDPETATEPSGPPVGAQPQNGPQYRDTRQMLLDADTEYANSIRRNDEINAGNIAQRDATQAEITRNYALKKKDIEAEKLKLDMDVDAWMTTSGPKDPKGNPTGAIQRPPPEIWNQLSYEKQRSIDATIAHNLKGAEIQTNQKVWSEIWRGLTSADANERKAWAGKSLWEYKPYLNNSDYQELEKKAGEVRKGDPSGDMTHIGSIERRIDDTLKSVLGVDPSQNADRADFDKAYNFRRGVQDAVTEFEKGVGRRSTPEEQGKIIDGVALQAAKTWGSSPVKTETHLQNFNDKINTRLNSLKIDPTPKPGDSSAKKVEAFKTQAQEAVTAYEQHTGRKADDATQQKIIDILSKPIVKGYLSDTYLFDVKDGDVPPSEKAKIMDEAKKKNIVITDGDGRISKAYRSMQVLRALGIAKE